MLICVIKLKFYLPEVHSLKEKRKIIKSLIEKTRKKFSVSIAEVGDNDLWQSSQVGFALIGNSKRLLEGEMEKILDFLEQSGEAEIVSVNHEIWSFK